MWEEFFFVHRPTCALDTRSSEISSFNFVTFFILFSLVTTLASTIGLSCTAIHVVYKDSSLTHSRCSGHLCLNNKHCLVYNYFDQ